MKTTIKKIVLQNFKGCKEATYIFDGKNVTVCGANGSGKTRIAVVRFRKGENMIHIESAVSKDCINLYSFGEICVGCGCCSRNPDYRNMIISRIRYYKQRLYTSQHYNDWDKDEQCRKFQEKIVKDNILYYKRKIRLNNKILRTLK